MAATLFLFLFLPLLRLTSLPSLPSSKDGRNGGWVGCARSGSAAGSLSGSARICDPLSAAFAAFCVFPFIFRAGAALPASQSSGPAASLLTQTRALSHACKTIFSFFAGQQVFFLYAHFHCEIEFSAWERPGRQDDDVDVDVACLLISPHGEATLFYYTSCVLCIGMCVCVCVTEWERESKNKASHSLRQP